MYEIIYDNAVVNKKPPIETCTISRLCLKYWPKFLNVLKAKRNTGNVWVKLLLPFSCRSYIDTLFQSFTLKTSCTSCCASCTSAVGFRSVNCGALSLISVTNTVIGTEADFDGLPP